MIEDYLNIGVDCDMMNRVRSIELPERKGEAKHAARELSCFTEAPQMTSAARGFLAPPKCCHGALHETRK